MLTRRRRTGESGQTLVLALSFLVMFSLIGVAVLSFASTVQHQRTETETTATVDSTAEGAAQFAIADTGVQACGTVTSGTMNFSGTSLTYSAPKASCGGGTNSVPGSNCAVCVLNDSPNNKGVITPVANPLAVSKGAWTVTGEVDVNGGIQITALASTASINQYLGFGGALCGAPVCTPAGKQITQQIVNPIALAVPGTLSAGSSPKANVYCPGYYSTTFNNPKNPVSLEGWGDADCPLPATVPPPPNVYVIDGSFGGNQVLVVNDTTLYFTTNAAFTFSGSGGNLYLDCGATSVTTPACTAAGTVPSTGLYAGVSLFTDPTYSGNLTLNGNGTVRIQGTIDAPEATLTSNGGGNCAACSFQSGRIIVSQLNGNGNGLVSFAGGGGVVTASGCSFYNVALNQSPSTLQPGHIRFENSCGTGGATAIVSFNYGNGP